MIVNKLISKVNKTKGRNGNTIKYIVIHYVGAEGSAKNNCEYFYDTFREASAHYFIGHEGEIWQCVNDEDTAWHCGDYYYGGPGGKFYGKCTNYNSLGIELCVKKEDNKWIYSQKTLDNTLQLVQKLMKQYSIEATNVIRHYDVSGKRCPENFIDETNWKLLHNKLTTFNSTELNNIAVVKYMDSKRREYYLNVYKQDKLEKLDMLGYYNSIFTIGTDGARNCYNTWDKSKQVACGESKGKKEKHSKILVKVVARKS